jgi:hypothetical protein
MKPSSALPVTVECDDDPKARKHLGRDQAEVVRRVRDEDVVLFKQEAGLCRKGADVSVDPAEVGLLR